jgi:MOSC domain-containing protein YiiM
LTQNVWPVRAVLSGKAVFFARGEKSAIVKSPIAALGHIGFLGLDCDEQADPRYHGGPDKALHHYPFDHYADWVKSAPDQSLLSAPGAFGENISTFGLTEDDVCIGDQFRLGTASVEISQGRQPCWKQGVRLDWGALPALMVKQRRSGWYYRVLETGEVQAGDALTLLERPYPEWTVSRVFGLLIAGDHCKDPSGLQTLSTLPPLYDGWKQRAVDLMRA